MDWARGQLEVECYSVERQSVCGYMMKIAINSRFEQVNIVAFGKSTSWDSFPKGSGLREEAARGKHMSPKEYVENESSE